MRGRALLLSVLAWCAVVATVAAITWTVIDAAGRDVLSGTGEGPLVPAPSTGAPSEPSDQPTEPSPGPSTPTVVSRTWQGLGGSVTARCSGRRVTASAVPVDGFSVRTERSDRFEVEVEFRSDRQKSEVYASCRDGVPQFEVEEDYD